LARLGVILEAERSQWFCWSPVLLGLGIGFYFSLGFEPHFALALAPLGVALTLWLFSQEGTSRMAVAALLAVCAGFAAAKVRTELTRAPVLPRPMQAVEVSGLVELVEPRATRGQRITMHVTKFGELARDDWPARVRIRTFGREAQVAPGEMVTVKATLAPPAAPVLPGGYDFARSAWFQRLGAVGYAMRAPKVEAPADADRGLGIREAIERTRQAIGVRVTAALPGETGAIATSLITGERGGISEATNEAFRDSGLLHILSISGLHMVVMAGAVFYAFRLLLAAIPNLALTYPIKKWAAGAAGVAALGYLLISGAAFATVRSYLMITIVFLAILIDRPAISMRNVALAALLILSLYPESLLDVGFQMSFAAVVAMVSAFEAYAARRAGHQDDAVPILLWPVRVVAGIVASTLVAGLAVAPLAAYHFHTSQQFAVVANLIAIPICNLIVMPAALLTLVLMPLSAEAPALWLMGQGIEAIVWCAKMAADLPGAVGHIAAVPRAAFLAMVAGGLWLCLWHTRWRLLGLAGLAIGAAWSVSPRLPDVLAGRDGKLVAVRGSDGLLWAADGARSNFELKRWLEHDGDARTPKEASKGGAWRCDGLGCAADVRGTTIALSRSPAALPDDCAKAGILILGFPAPPGCSGPKHIIDFFDLRNEGTHAFYLGADSLWTIETVAELRGDRPWSVKGTLGQRGRNRSARGEGAAALRPALPGVRVAPPRAEAEDEDSAEGVEED
jgi:competence protein ComEC